jgi:hypothetical protein
MTDVAYRDTTMVLSDRSGDLERLLAQPKSASYLDLRDRAAFIYATGAWPSHIRPRSDQLLSFCTDWSRRNNPAGNFVIVPDVAERLHLNDHPLVSAVRDHVAMGYRVSEDPASSGERRQPFGRVRLHREQSDGSGQVDEVTILLDGTAVIA